MSYQPDPKYFDWGSAFQGGIQQSQDNKRRNALMDLEQKQFGLQEQQFGMQEGKFAYEKELTERSRKGRVAGLTYFGLPPEMAEQVADDEDFPELFMQITGGGSATAPAAQRLAQWLANEATPRERAALEFTIRANQGKMVDVNGVPTMVNANLNQMPNFDALGPPRGYPSGGGRVETMAPYEPPAEMLDIPQVPFVPPLAAGPRSPAPPRAAPQAPQVAATGGGRLGGRTTPLSTPQAEQDARARNEFGKTKGGNDADWLNTFPKVERGYQSAIDSQNNVLDAVSRAEAGANAFTVGVLQRLKFADGSPQANLQAQITTIRANIGFDRLQQMRMDSPTGGALGQVAVQELEALQNSIASLEQSQGPTQFKENLKIVRKRYLEFQTATKRALEQDRARASQLRKFYGQADETQSAGGGWSIEPAP